MAVSIIHKTTGESSSNVDFYPTANILVTANRLIIAACRSTSVPSSVGGSAGITWSLYDSITNGTSVLSIWLGVATSPSNNPVHFNFSGDQNEACWSIVETDIPVSGAVLSTFIQQSAKTSGSSITGITATLLRPFVHTNNVTLGFVAVFLNRSITPGSGFTELGEAAGIEGSIQSQWFQGQDLTVDWAFSSSTGVVAFALEVGFPAIAGGFIHMST